MVLVAVKAVKKCILPPEAYNLLKKLEDDFCCLEFEMDTTPDGVELTVETMLEEAICLVYNEILNNIEGRVELDVTPGMALLLRGLLRYMDIESLASLTPSRRTRRSDLDRVYAKLKTAADIAGWR